MAIFHVEPPSVVNRSVFGPTATQAGPLEQATESSSGTPGGTMSALQEAPASAVVSMRPRPSGPAPTAVHTVAEEHATASKPPAPDVAPPGVGMAGAALPLVVPDPEAREAEDNVELLGPDCNTRPRDRAPAPSTQLSAMNSHRRHTSLPRGRSSPATIRRPTSACKRRAGTSGSIPPYPPTSLAPLVRGCKRSSGTIWIKHRPRVQELRGETRLWSSKKASQHSRRVKARSHGREDSAPEAPQPRGG